jgi:hypothetical protein
MKTLIATLMLITPANAFDMLPNYENAPAKVERVHVVKHQHKPKKVKAKKKKPTREGYSFRSPAPPPPPPDSVTRCLAPVHVVGSQDVRPDVAESSAQKAWMEQVRWTYGEAWQDFSNATEYKKRCSRSSIGEALGQYFTRCEITASPCKPGMIEGAK